MPEHQSGEHHSDSPATREQVQAVLGELADDKMLQIMELRPSMADVERAVMWLQGDADVFDVDQPVKGISSRIVTILTANEEEPPRSG